jgi:PLP dependent protein
MTGDVSMTDTGIADRLAAVQRAMEAACRDAGRSTDAVTLVAVSKTQPPHRIVEAARAGIRHFGENRVEEALEKIPAVAHLTDVQLVWHMVGTVQSRKARQIPGQFAVLHSLDSLRLAERLSRILIDEGHRLDVLLQVNVSGEATKQGWEAAGWGDSATVRQALWGDVTTIAALPALHVRGLMTMAPVVTDPEETRPVFVALRALRDALAADFSQVAWSALSMGMSDDYVVAIQEGATLIRIGRALFGERG